MENFTHFDDEGRARMVDVTEKGETLREALATARVKVRPSTFKKIVEKEIQKGDVLGVAKIAGIMAAKKTHELIPMCHPLPLEFIDIRFELNETLSIIDIFSTVKVQAKTGVEMEALVSVTLSALTIYDMCKGVDKGIKISDVRLLRKVGGKSGEYVVKDLKDLRV